MTIDSWPELPLGEWKDTLATLHMWTQIVGKIRLKQSPFENQWWNVPFYVTPRGLTTSAMPYNERLFQITFDFIDHLLIIETPDGSIGKFGLQPQSVAEFYRDNGSFRILKAACNHLDYSGRSTGSNPIRRRSETRRLRS